MRILYFTRTQSPHDLRFIQALAATRHQVFVLCLEPDVEHVWPEGIREIEWEGIDTKHGWLKMVSQIGRLKRGLHLMKPDLVHAGPIQSAAYLTVLAGYHPLVSMSWGSDLMLEANRSFLQQLITRYTLARTDVLVGDCACVGAKAVSFGFDLARYYQFPWGVDLDHFSPIGSTNLRHKLGWQNKTVLLSTRSAEPIYGLDVMVNAFLTAQKLKPDLRLIMLGKGLEQSGYAKMIGDHGLEEKVYFGGMATLDELPDVYRSADFYLSASHSDGSSVSLMEALACGLPVIVSDIPGNREWINEGENGWLFKDGDAGEFAAKILLAAGQMDSLNTMKPKNRQLAENRADWSKNFPVLLDAYEKAHAMAGSLD